MIRKFACVAAAVAALTACQSTQQGPTEFGIKACEMERDTLGIFADKVERYLSKQELSDAGMKLLLLEAEGYPSLIGASETMLRLERKGWHLHVLDAVHQGGGSTQNVIDSSVQQCLDAYTRK